jgi:hypothetical protein
MLKANVGVCALMPFDLQILVFFQMQPSRKSKLINAILTLHYFKIDILIAFCATQTITIW